MNDLVAGTSVKCCKDYKSPQLNSKTLISSLPGKGVTWTLKDKVGLEECVRG